VTILLGEKWRPGIWYAQAACVLAVVHVFYLLNADLLRALRMTQTFFTTNMLCAGLQITLILCAIPLGIRWVIIADIVARSIALVFLIGSVGKISKIQPMEQLRKFGTTALWGLLLMVVLIFARWSAPGIMMRLLFGFVVVLGFGLLWTWKYRTELRELIILRG
jgi:O-antigen/teichoic acid export membrane protein